MVLAKHVTVLLEEAIEGLHIQSHGIYVDATLGGGGHAEAILKQLPEGHLFAFDQDEFAIAFAKERLAAYSNITYVKANFRDLVDQLSELGITAIDGIVYDLGVSSFQFDIPERGFSYQHDSRLDMRMDQSQSRSAYDVVNRYPEAEIAEILFRYGEESYGRNIAKAIVRARAIAPIETTFQLVDVVKSALPMKELVKKGHPAKQTFQAIRIAVNDELAAFESSLEQAIGLLKPEGRISVITFHSLEDRIAKTVFRTHSEIYLPKGLPVIITEKPPLRLINKHVILPSDSELEDNLRAHSAKLRIAAKN